MVLRLILGASVVVGLCSCTDRDNKFHPCERVTHARLTIALSTDPAEPIVPFAKAEFVADRTVRFTNYCDILAGDTDKTECAISSDERRYDVTYSDAAPFQTVTLRVYDRTGTVQLERTEWSNSGQHFVDKCPEYSTYMGVRYVLDPPGLTDASTDGALDAPNE